MWKILLVLTALECLFFFIFVVSYQYDNYMFYVHKNDGIKRKIDEKLIEMGNALQSVDDALDDYHNHLFVGSKMNAK